MQMPARACHVAKAQMMYGLREAVDSAPGAAMNMPLHGKAVAEPDGREPDPRLRPRVVIVGGGFGGLAAAHALEGAEIDVLLLDAKNHHCFQPLLYQAATAALDASDIAWPIRHVLEKQGNATVLMAAVLGVDVDRKTVLSTAGEFAFDWLVLATGSSHSYFGRDEWSAYAPSLKTVEDAMLIRSRLLTAFERAETARTDEERARRLTFAIIGGGPTGVELAGALAELAACRTELSAIELRCRFSSSRLGLIAI